MDKILIQRLVGIGTSTLAKEYLRGGSVYSATFSGLLDLVNICFDTRKIDENGIILKESYKSEVEAISQYIAISHKMIEVTVGITIDTFGRLQRESDSLMEEIQNKFVQDGVSEKVIEIIYYIEEEFILQRYLDI